MKLFIMIIWLMLSYITLTIISINILLIDIASEVYPFDIITKLLLIVYLYALVCDGIRRFSIFIGLPEYKRFLI